MSIVLDIVRTVALITSPIVSLNTTLAPPNIIFNDRDFSPDIPIGLVGVAVIVGVAGCTRMSDEEVGVVLI